MDEPDDLPFKVGQLAESKSFEKGFRGAWFRCEIKEISWKKDEIGYTLEFYDFPDEEVSRTKLYEVPPYGRKWKDLKKHLMVRPHYPPMYHENQMPPFNSISEVAVIVEGVWKVGDLVDWYEKGCYWSGRVTKVLNNGKVQIQLPPPPVGEGEFYDASCKDLRPSLDWSPKDGWTVPIPRDGENFRCARLIRPVIQVNSLPAPGESSTVRQASKIPVSMNVSEEAPQTQEADMDLDMGDSVVGKASSSDCISTSHVQDAKAETTGHASAEELYCSIESLRSGGSIHLNSMCTDTLEAAILDLEELANKVKWIKGILEFGIPLPNDKMPLWTFLEDRASSTPK